MSPKRHAPQGGGVYARVRLAIHRRLFAPGGATVPTGASTRCDWLLRWNIKAVRSRLGAGG